ncbi:S24 family peptidase [Emcibacter nanhaiensis]|uniref:Helix-turn-helix transcriptional regulator n=1 Tax=Emcibacter nanhaiensis TaxID=1505037 RepID=A0A501PT18_9PROT|nr:S24 family peptidase [Emcibacter nanhaiensis]TPD63104.1 helix-turn-helix transcriptional regulator [Emcibacter nanhaiensis]
MDYNRYYKQIREKLDHLIRTSAAEDYASVSALIGKNHAYIQQYIKRGVPKCLNDLDLAKIIDHFGLAADYFGSPADFPTPSVSGENLPGDFSPDDYVLVNVYDIHAAAGAGAFAENNDIHNRLAFRKSWIRTSSNATPESLAVITVSGDSMSPTLQDGDHILVDMSERQIRNDGIYVLRNDDMLLVKRVSINPVTKLCTIKSDNPQYDSWSDCEPDALDILGRIIWMGRKI